MYLVAAAEAVACRLDTYMIYINMPCVSRAAHSEAITLTLEETTEPTNAAATASALRDAS